MDDSLRERLGELVGKLESVTERIHGREGMGGAFIASLDAYLDSINNYLDSFDAVTWGEGIKRNLPGAIDMVQNVVLAYNKRNNGIYRDTDIYNINDGLIWELWCVLNNHCDIPSTDADGKFNGDKFYNGVIGMNTLCAETLAELIGKIKVRYQNSRIAESA